jgi:hypothetical protein
MPVVLAVDDEHVYFAHYTIEGEGLLRVPKAGGSTTVFLAGIGYLSAAVDETDVYVSVMGMRAPILRVPKAGGEAITFVEEQDNPTGLVARNGMLYWITLGTVDGDGAAIRKVPLAGGPLETVAANLPSIIGYAMGETYVFLTLRVQSSADSYPSVVRRFNKYTGEQADLFTGTNASAVATDGEFVYWSAAPSDDEQYPTAIWRARVDGSTPEVIATGGSFIFEAGVSGECLYYTDDGGVNRVPKTGGPLSRFVFGAGAYGRFVFDEQHVYLANGAQVLKVAP